DATAGELRRTDGALPGAPGALLPVRLLATAADLTAALDLVGATARSGELCGDHLVDQWHVGDHIEDRCGQVHGAVGGTVRVGDVDRHVGLSGSGHLVHAPFAAERTTTSPPFGPGTAPASSSRPRSASTP